MYKCIYTVNGHRTEEIVSARSSSDAKALIQAKYAGSKIVWHTCTKIG